MRMGETRQYIPGTCNIGPAETKKRMRAGWTGLLVTIVLWTLFVLLSVPRTWRLTLFLPAVLSAAGFLQAYMRFCAYFGFAALFNLNELGKTETVEQAEFRAKDRKKAWQIVVYSILIGLVVALVAYVL